MRQAVCHAVDRDADREDPEQSRRAGDQPGSARVCPATTRAGPATLATSAEARRLLAEAGHQRRLHRPALVHRRRRSLGSDRRGREARPGGSRHRRRAEFGRLLTFASTPLGSGARSPSRSWAGPRTTPTRATSCTRCATARASSRAAATTWPSTTTRQVNELLARAAIETDANEARGPVPAGRGRRCWWTHRTARCCTTSSRALAQPRVKGFRLHPMWFISYEKLSLEPA